MPELFSESLENVSAFSSDCSESAKLMCSECDDSIGQDSLPVNNTSVTHQWHSKIFNQFYFSHPKFHLFKI